LHELLDDLRLQAQAAPIGGSLNLRAPVAISRVLARARPDVALVTTADEWVWSSLSRRPPGTRLVLVRHMALPLARRVGWRAARRADAVVAVSHAVSDALRAETRIPSDRLHVIYNPVRFTPRVALPSAADRRRGRNALGLPEDGRVVGFFGGRNSSK